MFLYVTKVTYLEGYRLRVEFSDGTVKDVDLAQELFGEVFEPLKDINLFRRAHLNPDTHTIEWPTGADFAPEFLHQIGEEVRRIA